jgi:hypothetical protein
MDLVTLITAWTLNVEPKLMHALIWKQSGGEPGTMPKRHIWGTAAHPACRALQHDVES